MGKKILFVTPFFVPAYSYGGIVRVAYEQAKGLLSKGYSVTVVTTDVRDAESRNEIQTENIEGIEILRFKNISNYLAKYQNLYLPIGMKKWLKQNIRNFDIVHIHDIYNLPTYWACKYSNINGVKYFIQPHGTLSQVSLDSRKKSIKLRILNSLKYYFDQANGLFGLTQVEIKEIQKVTDNSHIYELPNGIDIKKIQDIGTCNIHDKYNLGSNISIISFIGRIQYIKGLDIAFEILAKMDKKFPHWRFLIIGPDEGEKKKLEILAIHLGISDKIIWFGEENTNHKYELLKGSEIFLLLSRSEGFPMSILEALACGLPVYVSEGTKFHTVEDYHAGIFIRDDFELKEDKLLYLLKNANQYKNNLEKLLDNFSIGSVINNLIKYYENS